MNRPRPSVPCMLFVAFALTVTSGPLYSQDATAAERGPRFTDPLTQRWRVGVRITAPPRARCVGVYATAPVPTEWPEQTVKLVAQDVSPAVKKLHYRTLNNGVKQVLVEIPTLQPGQEAHAILTFEVTRHAIVAPEDPSVFVLPSTSSRELRPYLVESPLIEVRHNQIKQVAKEVIVGKAGAWEQVEAIYDWVREHVEYQEGKLKGALAALRDGTGDCEEMTSLFIALCRANRIPARTVWVPDHCYPEFYLEDADGKGYWIPCQAAGTRAFGGMLETRPVLQKGDNFRVPEKRTQQRYVAEFLKIKGVAGAGSPEVKFVRELLNE